MADRSRWRAGSRGDGQRAGRRGLDRGREEELREEGRRPDAARGDGDSAERGRGRGADSPREIPREGWKDVAKRTGARIGEDNVSIVAAGVAFYLFLAIFPAIAALFTIFGLVADPGQIQEQVARFVPGQMGGTLTELLEQQAQRPGGALGWTLALSLLLALWSTSRGVAALIIALNIAYHEPEERSFVRRALLSVAFSLGALVLAIVAVFAIGAVPTVLGMLDLGTAGRWAATIGSWVVLIGGFLVVLAALYRYGPNRRRARWSWITPGAVLAVGAWLVASAGFAIYLANFGNYDETYGSLAGVIILLLWLWISAFLVLVGGELNAEMEHQTAEDTTVGGDQPRGERGAHVADDLGRTPG